MPTAYWYFSMLILGIETSCDETATAVVEDGHRVICNVIFSSLPRHQKFGGVVPEIAVRAHLEKINLVLRKAKVDFSKIDFIAVTYGPGLIGSLLTGVSFAKGLSFSKKIPLIKVNHLLAHLYSPFLNPSALHRTVQGSTEFSPEDVFPAVGMVISGGHTGLIYLKSFEDYQLLGETRDDAAGEAFDKVAKILNLGYPGGPLIERLALRGDERKMRFNCANLKGFDFSFSGIKTAVLYSRRTLNQKVASKGFGCGYVSSVVNRHRLADATQRRNRYLTETSTDKRNLLNRKREASISDIAASFQKAVVDVLVEKAIAACLFKRCQNLILGGGVSANSYLKKKMRRKAKEKGIKVFYPRLEFSTDNAAMVAGLAYHLRNKKHFADLSLTPCANLQL